MDIFKHEHIVHLSISFMIFNFHSHLTDIYEAPIVCKAQGRRQTKDWFLTSNRSQFSDRNDNKYDKTLECYQLVIINIYEELTMIQVLC